MRKLTIVVGCTNRKSGPVEPELAVRSLVDGSVYARAEQWIERVEAAQDLRTVEDLYMGEAWLQARGLVFEAEAQGYDVDPYVVSAGLGLRSLKSIAPAYSATFARGHEDTVGRDAGTAVQWWRAIRVQSRATCPESVCGDSMLLVVSESYARVLAEDIANWAVRCDDLLVVGGAATQQTSSIARLPADRALRNALGGTVSSLTLRMARRLVGLTGGGALSAPGVRESFQGWAADARHVENYDRRTLSDDEVRFFLGELLGESPTISATRALRLLRNSGRGCEQRRFSRLHTEMAGRYASR